MFLTEPARSVTTDADAGTGIWEQAWYLRRMDLLMLDMITEDEKAVFLLDKVTDQTCCMAKQFAILLKECSASFVSLR